MSENRFYKIIKSGKKGNQTIFSNDEDLVKASREAGLNVIDIGVLSEDELKEYQERGVKIILQKKKGGKK